MVASADATCVPTRESACNKRTARAAREDVFMRVLRCWIRRFIHAQDFALFFSKGYGNTNIKFITNCPMKELKRKQCLPPAQFLLSSLQKFNVQNYSFMKQKSFVRCLSPWYEYKIEKHPADSGIQRMSTSAR